MDAVPNSRRLFTPDDWLRYGRRYEEAVEAEAKKRVDLGGNLPGPPLNYNNSDRRWLGHLVEIEYCRDRTDIEWFNREKPGLDEDGKSLITGETFEIVANHANSLKYNYDIRIDFPLPKKGDIVLWCYVDPRQRIWVPVCYARRLDLFNERFKPIFEFPNGLKCDNPQGCLTFRWRAFPEIFVPYWAT